MNVIIDIIAVVIIALSLFFGLKKGFIKSIMGLVSLVVAVILAINFQPYASSLIKDNVIEPYFVDKTSDKFSALFNRGSEVVPPEQIFEDKPEDLVTTTESFGFDIDALEEFYETNIKGIFDANDINGISDKFAEFLVENTVDVISSVLGFISVFLIAVVLLTIVQWLLNLIFKLPILKTANKLLGGIFGVIKGVLLVVILINIAFALSKSDTANTEFGNENIVSSSYTYFAADSVGLIF